MFAQFNLNRKLTMIKFHIKQKILDVAQNQIDSWDRDKLFPHVIRNADLQLETSGFCQISFYMEIFRPNLIFTWHDLIFLNYMGKARPRPLFLIMIMMILPLIMMMARILFSSASYLSMESRKVNINIYSIIYLANVNNNKLQGNAT